MRTRFNEKNNWSDVWIT